jgi:hypothetical protein
LTYIETIVAPDLGTRDAIAQAVAGIHPLGKTPMTDAVIAAAQALLYTEVSARVILVSDGTFRATNGEGGPVITDQVIWTIASDARVIAENETGNLIPLDAMEGTHRATATRVVQELTEETLFTASGAGDVRSPCPLPPPAAGHRRRPRNYPYWRDRARPMDWHECRYQQRCCRHPRRA